MSNFDEEHLDPHGECTAEIHRLKAALTQAEHDIKSIEPLYANPPLVLSSLKRTAERIKRTLNNEICKHSLDRQSIHKAMECARSVIMSYGGNDLSQQTRKALCDMLTHFENTVDYS